MEKKANHQVNIVRLGEPRVHTNADSLELFDIGEYQVVTKKGNFKAGDLGVYIQPDSVVPQTEPFKFIWEAYVGLDGTVPEKRRRITVRKFRGEWSEGLLLPLTDFAGWYVDMLAWGENKYTTNPIVYSPTMAIYHTGDDVSEEMGITHYDPDAGKETAGDAETFKKQRSKYPRSIKGWWYWLLHKLHIHTSGGQCNGFDNEDGVDMPVYDVDALKNYKGAFVEGEEVELTEKIHGSNARFVYRDEHMFAGSHTQWKAVTANCIWRKVLVSQPWIEEWCKANPGYGLYGEVTPTQGEKFLYGATTEKPQLFVFDIRTPEGVWLGVGNKYVNAGMKMNWVPILYQGPFDMKLISKFIDGQTTVPGAKGIREGGVLRPIEERHVRGLGRLILKVVSNSYLLKDTQ